MLASTSYSVSNSQTATALDPTQVYTTGNVVQNTPYGGPSSWVNGVYQDSLTCWTWGNPGYCGPNAIVRPDNNINFSFGLTNLYQMQAVANILPNSGSGLRVNGYNFGFTAKNGNGWDDARVDYLTAYVSFYDTKGSTVFNKNYDLNYKFNWTSFNYSENFTTPYAAKDLGSVQYGFVGRDNNGWAGPYGPEIYNISFSLKYSVDPCSVDVLSSPTCPGYLEALSKLASPTTTTTTTVEVTPTQIIVDNFAVNTQPVQNTSTAPTSSSPTPSTSATVSGTPSTTSTAQPVATVDANKDSKASGPSLNAILNIVKNEQSRISAVESSAVQQANETASSLTSAAVRDAENVAKTLTSASIAESQQTKTQTATTNLNNGAGLGLQTTNQLQNGLVGILKAPGDFIQPEFKQEQVYTPSILNRSQESIYSLFTPSQTTQQNVLSLIQELPKYEQPKFEDPVQKETSYVASTIPRDIQAILEETNKPAETTQTQTSGDSVKKDVKNNDAAGSVDIASIATIPAGFSAYTNLTLRDGMFYKTEEIYKNQRTVDNVRVLRGLQGGSDILHQQMVNQQYERK